MSTLRPVFGDIRAGRVMCGLPKTPGDFEGALFTASNLTTASSRYGRRQWKEVDGRKILYRSMAVSDEHMSEQRLG